MTPLSRDVKTVDWEQRRGLVDYARHNENFVLVVTSSCCIRWDSTDIKGEALG
jgi:hypothetical protein